MPKGKEKLVINAISKVIISLVIIALIGLIGFCFVPMDSEIGQTLQGYTRNGLFLVGKCVGWCLYLGTTFLTQEIFTQAETIKGKVLTFLIQLIAVAAMLSPYLFINALESEVLAHLGAVVVLWLMIWPVCFWQRKKIVSVLKQEATPTTNA